MSTYAFGKLLTERLVGEAQLQGVSKVIVRPSLISSLAGDPYPGYINNFAGSPGFMMAYGAGFFHSISSMAYASDYLLDLIPCDTVGDSFDLRLPDYLLDLIPCDTVAALINAAAAAGAADAGPAAAPGVTIYHAASAAVYPLHMAKAIGAMAEFWTANPPPLRLPFSTYFTYQGKHEPSAWGLAIGRWLTEAKLWPICKVLEWSGRGRKALLLRNAFKALCVQNSFNYNRSIVSCVDNCQALRKRIEPKEQPAWHIIYDGAAVNWDDYGLTFLSGVRRLLFRCPGESTGHFINLFVHKPDAPAAIRELITQASPPPPSSTALLRSADSYIGAAAAPLSSRSSSNSSMACSESSSVEAAEMEAAVSPAAEAQVVVTAAVDGAGKGLAAAAAALKVQLSVDAGRVVVAAC
uniref:Fatty acyl-CoA reductase n=1 Tax=Tetradesmus obliquus TaxID=3088 RepID=A0A383W7V3_TETOB|eukprot:jgi/Sobl393_1/3679/SZX73199.1